MYVYLISIMAKQTLQNNILKSILHKTEYTVLCDKWSHKKSETEQKTKYTMADISPHVSLIKLIN